MWNRRLIRVHSQGGKKLKKTTGKGLDPYKSTLKEKVAVVIITILGILIPAVWLAHAPVPEYQQPACWCALTVWFVFCLGQMITVLTDTVSID